MINKSIIYTIGHSTHQIETFLNILKFHLINCIIDVRSVPASTYNPQYNKEFFSDFLSKNGIRYLHFGEEFGARHNSKYLLDEEGKVDFEKVRGSEKFKKGIQRLVDGTKKGFKVALMCSEGDPFECHRFSMISYELKKMFDLYHIYKDGKIKSNEDLEAQLLKKYQKQLPQPTIFEPEINVGKQLDLAYRFRNKDIAFSPSMKKLNQE